MTQQDALAASLAPHIGTPGYPGPDAVAASILDALAASGWTLAPVALCGFKGCGKREDDPIHPQPFDRMPKGGHVFRGTLAPVDAEDDLFAASKALKRMAQPAPDPLGPDDHGHTGRLWCDPCVGHGVMLEQGMHRCQPAPDPLREALDTPMYDWLDEYGPAKAWDEAMDLVRAALAAPARPDVEKEA